MFEPEKRRIIRALIHMERVNIHLYPIVVTGTRIEALRIILAAFLLICHGRVKADPAHGKESPWLVAGPRFPTTTNYPRD